MLKFYILCTLIKISLSSINPHFYIIKFFNYLILLNELDISFKRGQSIMLKV